MARPGVRRQQWVLIVVAIVAVAVALRLVPLYWSPLPSTLDGFGYAAQARDTIALGQFPLAEFRADNFVFAGLLAVSGLVLGVQPLYVAQPVVAIAGAGACVAGVAIAWRLARRLGWSRERRRAVVLFCGFGLAASGLFLRRTSEPDEEALALLLVPLVALALYRLLRTERPAWGVVVVVLLGVFPILHTFSTLLAALTLTALVAMVGVTGIGRRPAVLGIGLVGGFWVYFATYYEVAARTVLSVPYVGRVTAHPGLFLAWTVVLVVGVVWVRAARPWVGRVALLGPVVGMFVVLVANVFQPVFPGTVPSPPLLVAVVFVYLVFVFAAVRSVPAVVSRTDEGAVVVALVAAPLAHVGFSLTAALTPEFFGTVIRTQTFAHLPVVVLAALTVGRVAGPGSSGVSAVGGRWARYGVVGVLCVSVVLTTPVAFVTLDTVSVPSTTTEAEFAGVSFASATVPSTWSTDHKLSRVGGHYYDAAVSVGPVGGWLRGGAAPTCAVVAERSWTTRGAHLFPAAPETIGAERYHDWLTTGSVVYGTSGRHGVVLRVPAAGTAGC